MREHVFFVYLEQRASQAACHNCFTLHLFAPCYVSHTVFVMIKDRTYVKSQSDHFRSFEDALNSIDKHHVPS